jgi:hypothetical protein
MISRYPWLLGLRRWHVASLPLAGTADSKSAGSIDILSAVRVVCCFKLRPQRRTLSLVSRSPSDIVSLCVIKRDNNPVYPQWLCGKRSKKERRIMISWQFLIITSITYNSQWPSGLRPLVCLDWGFESRQGRRYLSIGSVACCRVYFSATSRSLVYRNLTGSVMSLCMI